MALLGHSRTAEQQQELREAKRLLRDRVRNDWHYPSLPAYRRPATRRRMHSNDTDSEGRGDIEEKDASFRFKPVDLSTSNPLGAEVPEVTGWQERAYSTESESGGDEVSAATNTATTTKVRAGVHGKQSTEFRFEGPDSVGSQIRERKAARRRKRIMAVQEELSWNEGLGHWTAQRDAWSGARAASTEEPNQDGGAERRAQSDARRVSYTTGGFAISAESTPRTSTSSITSPVLTSSAATTPDPTTQHPPHALSGSTPSRLQNTAHNEPLIPTCAPILPHHPIRRRITPAMYTEIYTKIILQGRTPSVPINLLTLVSALVEGWKADGEWPPKAGIVEPSIGRRKRGKGSGSGGSGVREGVKAVVRTLKLVGSSEVGSRKDS